MAILVMFDAVSLPTYGWIASAMFVFIMSLGLWKMKNYKDWFLLSLVYICIASVIYFLGGRVLDETVIQKLSDWSLFFLIGGVIRLARHAL